MRISDWSSDVCSSDLFSLAALALIRLQSVTLHTAADLDGKTLGQIVAHNLMMEIQTDPAPPSIGKDVGEIENGGRTRSEEHTSELQSLMRISYAVFCLQKKNHRSNYT